MRRAIKEKLRFYRSVWRMRRQLAGVVRSHVYFLENRSLTMWGGLSDEDLAGIRRAVGRAEEFAGPIVEIGALFGWTTQLLASLKSTEKELIAVDNFCWNPFGVPPEDHRAIALRTLHYCLEHCRTSLFDGSAADFYRTYGGPTPSMVFIDADHSYAASRADIAWAMTRGVPVIAGHDYSPLHPGVVRSVEESFAGRFDVVGSVWIASGKAEGEAASRAASQAA
jgi:hypothetical protein